MQHNEHNWDNLLEDYQHNRLTPARRYELEKAALDDPFLFDALEGFALYGANAVSDRGTVPGAAKATAVFSFRNMAVAASLLALVAVVGYMQTATNGRDLVASTDTIAESAEPSDGETTDANTPIAMVTESTPEETVEQVAVVQGVQKEAPTESAKIAKKTVVQDGVKASLGQEVEEQVPAGTSAPAPKPTIATIESNSKELIKAKEEESMEAVVDTREKVQKSTTEATSLRRSSSQLSKDLLKGQKPERTFAPTNDISGDAVNKLVSPAKGWKNFEQYLADNKKKVSNLKPVVVTLSFTVSADGEVQDVRSQKSACSVCEEDAKELLTKSGLWSNTTGQPQQMQYVIKY